MILASVFDATGGAAFVAVAGLAAVFDTEEAALAFVAEAAFASGGALAGAFALTGAVAFTASGLADLDALPAAFKGALVGRNAAGAAFCRVAAPAVLMGADALRAAGAVDLAAVFLVRSLLLFTAFLALAEEEALVEVAALAGAFVVLGLACGFALFKGARAADAAAERFEDEALRAAGSVLAVLALGAFA